MPLEGATVLLPAGTSRENPSVKITCYRSLRGRDVFTQLHHCRRGNGLKKLYNCIIYVSIPTNNGHAQSMFSSHKMSCGHNTCIVVMAMSCLSKICFMIRGRCLWPRKFEYVFPKIYIYIHVPIRTNMYQTEMVYHEQQQCCTSSCVHVSGPDFVEDTFCCLLSQAAHFGSRRPVLIARRRTI